MKIPELSVVPFEPTAKDLIRGKAIPFYSSQDTPMIIADKQCSKNSNKTQPSKINVISHSIVLSIVFY